MVEMTHVDSTGIESIGYDEDKNELHICFHHSPGDVYVYLGVPLEIFEGLQSADSVGSFFNREVRSTYKDFEKRPMS